MDESSPAPSAPRRVHVFHDDLRLDTPENRSLDAIVPLALCAEEMRRTNDDRTIPIAALEGVIVEFGQMNVGSAWHAGISAPDVLYCAICRLTVLDRFTRRYVETVIMHYFRLLAERGVRCFYIVDNTIREDRFGSIVELFELAGFAVVSPHLQDDDWPALDRRLRQHVKENRHVFYVEKDTSVNFLDAVRQLATDSGLVSTFRREASDTGMIEILATGRSAGSRWRNSRNRDEVTYRQLYFRQGNGHRAGHGRTI